MFWSSWRHHENPDPIFILGHQRSGTTLLHRSLASDAGLVASRLWQMIFPPLSVGILAGKVAAIDQHLGGFGGKLLAAWEERRFGEIDRLHQIRLNAVEEDEFVFWSIFSSAMCANDSPVSMNIRRLDRLRDFDGWPDQRKHAAMKWFRDCLRKRSFEIQRLSAPARPLVKNPAFTSKIQYLQKYFPDARFILLMRNPMTAIPSRLNLIRAIWRARLGEDIELERRHVEMIYRDSLRLYRSAENDFWHLPVHQRLLIRYEQITDSFASTLASTRDWLGIPQPPGMTLPKKMPSGGKYSLEEFGLDRRRVEIDLKPVLERFPYE
jgi:hypothetical protein